MEVACRRARRGNVVERRRRITAQKHDIATRPYNDFPRYGYVPDGPAAWPASADRPPRGLGVGGALLRQPSGALLRRRS